MHQDGYTALMWAAKDGDAVTVTLLLDNGASIDAAEKVEILCEWMML